MGQVDNILMYFVCYLVWYQCIIRSWKVKFGTAFLDLIDPIRGKDERFRNTQNDICYITYYLNSTRQNPFYSHFKPIRITFKGLEFKDSVSNVLDIICTKILAPRFSSPMHTYFRPILDALLDPTLYKIQKQL